MPLKAETPVYGGYVIGREEGVVFIKGAIPGEVVDVSIREKKKDYSVAIVTEIIEPSAYRVQPLCPHFGVCGGCQLQHMSYDKQVSIKSEIILDCLERIGGIKAPLSEALTGDDFHYRRRAQFKVSKEGAIGFYKEGTRDVVPIDSCPILKSEINDLLKKLKSMNLSGIKEIHVTFGDRMLGLIKGRPVNAGVVDEMRTGGFDGVAFEDLSYAGAGYAVFDLSGLIYKVSPWSFFQSNWELNLRAVEILLENLGSVDGKKIIDLYAGAGNFSLPLASKAGRIVAIEENPNSVKDGERNLSSNNITNVKFINAKVEKAGLKSDVLILDPPRPGLTDRTVKAILEAMPDRVVYISCNPSTLARDLKKLATGYDIESVRLMDFFPNTYHIETMTFLRVKS